MSAIIILILSSTLIIYMFLWYSFVKKIYGGGYHIGGKIVKVIFLLPFWGIFLIKILMAYFPEIELLALPAFNKQEISFENDMKSEIEFIVVKRMDSTNDWVPAYKLNKRVYSPFIKLVPGEADLFEYRGDHNDAIYAMLSNQSDPVHNTINAKPIPVLVPSAVQKFYVSEIARSRAKAINILLDDEYMMFLIMLIGIQGFWYHSLRVRKIIQKSVAIFFALNITFFAGLIVYFNVKTILFFFDLF